MKRCFFLVHLTMVVGVLLFNSFPGFLKGRMIFEVCCLGGPAPIATHINDRGQIVGSGVKSRLQAHGFL